MKLESSTSLRPVLLTVGQVSAVINLAPRTIRAMVSSGEFPRPVKIGRLSRWRLSDVEQWVASLQ